MSSKLSSVPKKWKSFESRPYVRPVVDKTIAVRAFKKRTIEDLSDDCLKTIFSRMSLKQKFAVERVSKRWQSLVSEELENQTALIIGSNGVDKHQRITENRCSHYVCDQIEDTNNLWLKSIANKCKKVKSIVIKVNMNEENIEWITNNFPTLECIHLKECELQMRDGLRVANFLCHTIRHLSLNCKSITGECVANLISNLPLLEELEIIRFVGQLDSLFLGLNKFVRSVSVEECTFTQESVDALSRLNPNLNITTLRVSTKLGIELDLNLFPMICNSFPHLKHLSFGCLDPRRADLRILSNLRHLEELKLSFYYEAINWAQNCQNMNSLKSLELILCQLTGPVLESMLQIMPNLEKLSITNPLKSFGCMCDRREFRACDQCLSRTYSVLSRFQRLRQIQFNSNRNDSRLYVVKQFQTIVHRLPALDKNAFPSLRRVRIDWQSFPRPLKRPLFDGLVFLAKRNPKRIVILETGVGICCCHNRKLKDGWISAIGSRRLSQIPPNLKLMFFRDIQQ